MGGAGIEYSASIELADFSNFSDFSRRIYGFELPAEHIIDIAKELHVGVIEMLTKLLDDVKCHKTPNNANCHKTPYYYAHSARLESNLLILILCILSWYLTSV